MIHCKRAYEAPCKKDGYRVLIDRIWPRGISKADLELDGWFKDIAPSTELRQWFNHSSEKWLEFQERYTAELASSNINAVEQLKTLRIISADEDLCLIFAAKDKSRNNAIVLAAYLETHSE